MNDIKIIKELGHGMLANVYLCSIKQNEYALKVERMPEGGLEYDLSIQEWREIEFSQNFGNNYPNQFVTLCDYKIEKINDDNKDIVKTYKIKNKFGNSTKKRLLTKNKSNYCIKKIYSLIDDTLKNVIDTLTLKQLYSTIVQISYICFLLQIHGYTHNDLHLKNIGIIRTNNEYVTLLDKKVKTHGIHIKIIDFGIALHKKYNLNDEELTVHKYGLINEITRFLIRLVKFEENDQIDKIISWNDAPEAFDEFVKSEDYYLVKDMAINPYDRFYVYQMLYPKKFQKMYLRDDYVKTYKPIFRCNIEDVLYIFKHKLDLRKIMKHFYKKL